MSDTERLDFALSAEQSLLKESLTEYFTERHSMAARRNRLASERGWSAASWQRFAADIGALGASLPEELGGIGGGAMENMVIMETMGEHLVLEPYLETIVIGAQLIAQSAHPQRAQLVAQIIAGDAIIALAQAEPQARHCLSDVRVQVRQQGAELFLHGRKAMVSCAPWATHWIVVARSSGGPRDEDGLSLFLVERGRPGIQERPYRTVDGFAAADLDFVNTPVSVNDLLGPLNGGFLRLEHILDAAAAALCAEAVGCMRSALAQTLTYARQRKQFGKPLSSFQALQHRLVDMYVLLEHSISYAYAASASLGKTREERRWMIAAAKYYIGNACNVVGRGAVQIHGAIGMMEETPLAQYFKRLTVIQGQCGSTSHYLSRFAADCGVTLPAAIPLQEAEEDAAFRHEVRTFLDQHLTGDLLREAERETGAFARPTTTERWRQLLFERGWSAPSWPSEYGGAGWSARQRYIFEAEMEAAGAPRLPAMGLQMCGPVIMKFGTAEQKAFYLPKILSGEHYWCQGYSEPNSGSDLASVQLRAVRDGDDYVLNGTKLWTTFAQYANWIFLLVRTSTEGKPPAGISFLLAPLDSPGITIRPLISFSGDHEVNQVFFDNVRVPVRNRVGEENGGWSVAKYLLEFERGVGHQVPALAVALNKLRGIAQQERSDSGSALWEDAAFRRRFAALEIEAHAAYLTEQRLVYSNPPGQAVGDATASLMKITWSEAAQAIDELMIDALGIYAPADQHAALEPGSLVAPIGPAYALTPMVRYLNDRMMTIAGGSSEVQRNILARNTLNI